MGFPRRSVAAILAAARADADAASRTPFNEALFIKEPGLGASVAYFVFNGFQTATMNWQSFSQVTFAFYVTPELLIRGIVWASVIGVVQGQPFLFEQTPPAAGTRSVPPFSMR